MSSHCCCTSKEALEIAWGLIKKTVGTPWLEERQKIYGTPVAYVRTTSRMAGVVGPLHQFWLGGTKHGCIITFSESSFIHSPQSTMKCKTGTSETKENLSDEIFENLKTVFRSIPATAEVNLRVRE